MPNTMNAHRLGLALGCGLGAWHLVWSLFVLFGWAEALFTWVLKLHFMRFPVTFLPFDFMTAAMLVVVTTVLGYVMGLVVGTIWNSFQK